MKKCIACTKKMKQSAPKKEVKRDVKLARVSTAKGKAKVKKVMKEFKSDKLHSGSKTGPLVHNPKQAIAISLSEARKSSRKSKK